MMEDNARPVNYQPPVIIRLVELRQYKYTPGIDPDHHGWVVAFRGGRWGIYRPSSKHTWPGKFVMWCADEREAELQARRIADEEAAREAVEKEYRRVSDS